ncbi:MAG: amino acid ABC transporter ATP-binding protein [Myxococcota bacterium]|jgi:ABC-type polar amino acid transport system ATPase subunit
MIRIRDLHKTYPGHQPLFRGINLEVAKGESVVFIGPSGSGKSSLLRCVNGLEFFQRGEIHIGDIALHSINQVRPGKADREALRKVRQRIGMVFQQFNLFPHMTALQNIIEAPVHVLKMSRDEAVEQARVLLRRVNLENRIDSYPWMLSGGEQQRVAIARALAMKPQAMLFDEPTSSLDPEMTGEVQHVIKELVNEGMTSIISTHEMDFARDAADRIMVLDKGEIVEVAAADDLFTSPKHERTKAFLSRVAR